MAHPTCSIIVPCYNYGRYLPAALESALAQTVPAQEIVVVDDGSTDDTQAVAAQFAGRGVRYMYQANGGLSAARNTAIAHTTGDYVALLDADDAFHPRKLELQIAAMEADRSLAAVGTLSTSFPGPFAPVETDAARVLETFASVPLAELAVRQQFVASSMVLRRGALEPWLPEVFDTALRGAEDWDCWLRLAERHTVGNLLLPLTGYRDQISGLGSQPHVMAPALDRLLEKATERGLWERPGFAAIRHTAYAHRYSSTAIMRSAHGQHGRALMDLVRSWRNDRDSIGVARARLAAVALLRLLKLKGTHKASIGQ